MTLGSGNRLPQLFPDGYFDSLIMEADEAAASDIPQIVLDDMEILPALVQEVDLRKTARLMLGTEITLPVADPDEIYRFPNHFPPPEPPIEPYQ